jgi:hypothetical protein
VFGSIPDFFWFHHQPKAAKDAITNKSEKVPIKILFRCRIFEDLLARAIKQIPF